MKKIISQSLSPARYQDNILFNADIIGKREHENNWEGISFHINEVVGL